MPIDHLNSESGTVKLNWELFATLLEALHSLMVPIALLCLLGPKRTLGCFNTRTKRLFCSLVSRFYGRVGIED